MTGAYQVAQSRVPEEDWADCCRSIEADNERQAAERYVLCHHAELDYREEVLVRVRSKSDSIWLVTVFYVPDATAKRIQ